MLASKAFNTAKIAMESGLNCCEAILSTVEQVWPNHLSKDSLAAAALFGEGMGSGCTCGALVGMIMASGILGKSYPHPLGKSLSKHLNNCFKQEFGSACCLVIKKNRPVWQRLGRQACINLTARSAAMLVEEWEGVISATTNLDNHSNL